MTASRLGVSVMPLEARHAVRAGLATSADRLGYEAVGLPESWSYDMTVLPAEAAARTQRVTLSTGILSVWGRSPATLAMAASTLWTVSGGRFVLGLGASTAQLVEGRHQWFVACYLTTMDTLSRQTLGRHGYGSAVEAVLAANSPKLTEQVPAKADDRLHAQRLPPDAPGVTLSAGQGERRWHPRR